MSEDGLTPQQRWHKKNGYIKKSFWMYQEQADEFKLACESQGKKQSDIIKKLMAGYVDGSIKID